MRQCGCSVAMAVVTAGIDLALIATPPVTAEVTLAATALYMGGTAHPLSVPRDSPDFIGSYVDGMADTYIRPSGLCAGGDPGCTTASVYTPQDFLPVTGWRSMTFDRSVAVGLANLDSCLRGLSCLMSLAPFHSMATQALQDTVYTVMSYSQSGRIATLQKRQLIDEPVTAAVSFAFTANPNRPNGGILQRFAGAFIPGLGVTFDGATPTGSSTSNPLTTVDVARQYDAIADFPTNPLNLLADLNALLGYFFVHPRPTGFSEPELQGQYQDSTYYLVPTPILPLLMPLAAVPLLGPLLAEVLDPPLRVLVEAGYDRTVNPGAPSRANVRYAPDPKKTLTDFIRAIPTGWDNGIASLTGNPGNRPFGTTAPGPYGVGGPPVYAGAVDPYGPPTALTRKPSLAAARTAPPPGVAAPTRRGSGADHPRRARNLPARAVG